MCASCIKKKKKKDRCIILEKASNNLQFFTPVLLFLAKNMTV